MTRKRKQRERIPDAMLGRMADVLRVLAHARRLRIVEILEAEGEAPVHAITAALPLPQATVSDHLNRMRRAGLIEATRRGREVWYRIADRNALTILECIRKKRGRL